MSTDDIDEAIALADRIMVLSPLPARILGELRIDEPRAVRGQLIERDRLADAIDMLRPQVAAAMALFELD